MEDNKVVIQVIIDSIHAKSYLEIGVDHGLCINNIVCEKKVGVDPDAKCDVSFNIGSDEFFKKNKEKFDVIFIDGLHKAKQFGRDIKNALNILNDGGYIICHDVNPHNEIMQKVPRLAQEWTGDVWKTFVMLRNKPFLKISTVDSNYGYGIIQKGRQKPIRIIEKDLNYLNFVKNKKKWLNLVSFRSFYDQFFKFHNYSLVCASHNEALLSKNLLSSSLLEKFDLQIIRGYDNVPRAYNKAFDSTKNKLIIYLHEDMFLPDGFFPSLNKTLYELEKHDPNWGVVGVAGASAKYGHINRGYQGTVGTLGKKWHKWIPMSEKDGPFFQEAETLDECLLIVKKDCKFIFDEEIPSSHHMFGADLCLQSRSRGMKNYCLNAHAHHNSPRKGVQQGLTESCEYIKKKWHKMLPILTTCAFLDKD